MLFVYGLVTLPLIYFIWFVFSPDHPAEMPYPPLPTKKGLGK